MQKTTGVVWDPQRVVILPQESLFCMQKPLEPIETSASGANHAVLHAPNHRWGLELIETSHSGANHADLQAQNDRWGLVHTETCDSAPKVAVLHAKTTDEC